MLTGLDMLILMIHDTLDTVVIQSQFTHFWKVKDPLMSVKIQQSHQPITRTNVSYHIATCVPSSAVFCFIFQYKETLT